MAEAGPLSSEDIQQLESSLLPSLERHHLRLLAHTLRCLQQIAGRRAGTLPPKQAVEGWLASQPDLQADPAFQQVFGQQLQKAAEQLERIAASMEREPLGLDLADLGSWADRQARSRLRPAG
jgi:glutamine synthetase adenylyltransferase